MSEVTRAPRSSPQDLTDWCLEALRGSNDVLPMRNVDLSKLTIVVPSKCRQDYLLRQIRYWSATSAQLIIVDGTSLPIPSEVRHEVNTHPRIEYHHIPSSLNDRLHFAGGMIETPYAVMLSDDEFHLPTGLAASIRVLEGNPELAGCMGQVLSITPMGDRQVGVFARAYPSLHGYNVRNSQPAKRLVAAMANYVPATCYAVLRTPIWESSWGSVGKFSSGAAMEIQQAMAVYLLGQFGTTANVQWLRSSENPTLASGTGEEDRKIWFSEWWNEKEYADERSDFCRQLADLAAEHSEVPHAECAKWISSGAEAYVAGRLETRDPKESFGGLIPRALARTLAILRTMAGGLPVPVYLRAKRVQGQISRLLGRADSGYFGSVKDLQRLNRACVQDDQSDSVNEIASVEAIVREFHSLRVAKSSTPT